MNKSINEIIEFGTHLWDAVYTVGRIFELARQYVAEARIFMELSGAFWYLDRILFCTNMRAINQFRLTDNKILDWIYKAFLTFLKNFLENIKWVKSRKSNYLPRINYQALCAVVSSTIWHGFYRLEDRAALALVSRDRPFPRLRLNFQSRRSSCFLVKGFIRLYIRFNSVIRAYSTVED